MFLSDGIDTRKKSSLFDIHLTADRMRVHGLQDLKLTYIRIIRHYGVNSVSSSLVYVRNSSNY